MSEAEVPGHVVGTIHEQTNIAHGEWEGEVDSGIADLILEVWRAGWETIRSCEDHSGQPGRVWIEFANPLDVVHFLDAVAEYDPHPTSLWNRAKAWSFGQYGATSYPLGDNPRVGAPSGAWEYHLSVSDGSYDEGNAERVSDDPAFMVSVSVLFPATDAPVVLQRLRDLNADSRHHT